MDIASDPNNVPFSLSYLGIDRRNKLLFDIELKELKSTAEHFPTFLPLFVTSHLYLGNLQMGFLPNDQIQIDQLISAILLIQRKSDR